MHPYMNKDIAVAIVEDNDDIRKSLAAFVENAQGMFCVAQYTNAETALKEIPELLPDIVLMDIGLPKMNGIDCIRKLKPLCPGVQFMICTIYDEDEKIFDALQAGANSYILKRSKSDVLIEAIRDLYEGGSPMSSDIARKIVLSFQKKQIPDRTVFGITPREEEILNLLAEGLSYKEIAAKIFISIKTIRKHIYNIYEKLHVDSRMEAVNKFFGKRHN
jgi:two-component system, NarL family, response regulator LiaR